MIKVKALEWRVVGLVRHHVSEPNTIYSYRVMQRSGSYLVRIDTEEETKGMDYHTLTAAKAACQAHHEQHVLSMITEVADGAE